MSYNYSQIDKDNIKWFDNDTTVKSLKSISLNIGTLRGLTPFKILMRYPITVIAGKNGSGKSTILALACCAYHNNKKGYIPFEASRSYYTFSDFFVQTSDEIKVEGIQIKYGIFNKWRQADIYGKFDRIGYQIRKKKKGGKWNDYEERIKRNVVFSGIQRIVPPSERKTEKSYSSKFTSEEFDDNTKRKIMDIAGRILGKSYTSLDIRTINKRRLFVVDRALKHYSGFNMGAGENAIFSLLIELYAAGKGALMVIDEIELGLHEESQRKLMNELKNICNELHCQIICSTHSSTVIDSLPFEARFFVDLQDDKTDIIQGISSGYAMGKLTGGLKKELAVYTEDEMGMSIVQACLPLNIRERVNIIPIGSDQAVLKQLSARYRESMHDCIAFLDGDKRKNKKEEIRQIEKHLEDRNDNELNDWIEKRLNYIPGKTWPEFYVLSLAKETSEELGELWGISKLKVISLIDDSLQAGKHNEFFHLSQCLSQDIKIIRNDIIRIVSRKYIDEFNIIGDSILEVLNE